MKKLLYLTIIITSFALFYPALTSAQWYSQESGTTEDLNSICFTDSLNGFAVGNNGVLLHTDDGGLNWEDHTIDTSDHLKDVFFIDSLNGWITGFNNEPWSASTYRTTNGGIEWEEISQRGFNAVFFVDTLTGWAVSGNIWKTSDGGINWDKKYEPHSGHSIFFSDSLNGWVTGGFINGSTGYVSSFILNTSDGGNSWNYQISSHIHLGAILYDIYFSDNLNGWAVGGGRWGLCNDLILRTTNGGIEWDTMYYDNNGRFLYSICFSDSLNGWAVGDNTFHLEYGGDIWSIQNDYCGGNSASFPDENNGWIVGDNGAIFHNSPTIYIDEQNRTLNSDQLKVSPNPFNSITNLKFKSTQHGKVEIRIFNQLGELVETIQKNAQPGKHIISWDAKGLPSGIYFVRLQVDNELITKKMIKLK